MEMGFGALLGFLFGFLSGAVAVGIFMSNQEHGLHRFYIKLLGEANRKRQLDADSEGICDLKGRIP
jgi:hypothetical protein